MATTRSLKQRCQLEAVGDLDNHLAAQVEGLLGPRRPAQRLVEATGREVLLQHPQAGRAETVPAEMIENAAHQPAADAPALDLVEQIDREDLGLGPENVDALGAGR